MEVQSHYLSSRLCCCKFVVVLVVYARVCLGVSSISIAPTKHLRLLFAGRINPSVVYIASAEGQQIWYSCVCICVLATAPIVRMRMTMRVTARVLVRVKAGMRIMMKVQVQVTMTLTEGNRE